jgi:hypothetical protein
VSHFPPHWSALYELTRLNDDEFSARLAVGTIKPDMERGAISRAPAPRVEAEADRGPRRIEHHTRKLSLAGDSFRPPARRETNCGLAVARHADRAQRRAAPGALIASAVHRREHALVIDVGARCRGPLRVDREKSPNDKLATLTSRCRAPTGSRAQRLPAGRETLRTGGRAQRPRRRAGECGMLIERSIVWHRALKCTGSLRCGFSKPLAFWFVLFQVANLAT